LSMGAASLSCAVVNDYCTNIAVQIPPMSHPNEAFHLAGYSVVCM
jgi:hypothetical protein